MLGYLTRSMTKRVPGLSMGILSSLGSFATINGGLKESMKKVRVLCLFRANKEMIMILLYVYDGFHLIL